MIMTEMKQKYHVVCDTESEKYDFLAILRGLNVIGEPSGYGDGYYIAFECEPEVAEEAVRRWTI